MNKLHPTPWRLFPEPTDPESKELAYRLKVLDANSDTVVRITGTSHIHATPEEIEIGRLIAAAPTLLRLCQNALCVLNAHAVGHATQKALVAEIAKLKGEQP